MGGYGVPPQAGSGLVSPLQQKLQVEVGFAGANGGGGAGDAVATEPPHARALLKQGGCGGGGGLR